MKKISVFALCALVLVTGCKMKPQIEEEQREELVEVAPLTASLGLSLARNRAANGFFMLASY